MIVEWIADCIGHLREKDLSSIAPTLQAEQEWVDHSNEIASQTLLTDTESWFMGANIPGKARALLLYANTVPEYRKRCRAAADGGYKEFVLQ